MHARLVLRLVLTLLAAVALTACDARVDVHEPPPQPRTAVCCGCLCLDETWSCNAATCLAADGGVVELGPEAGLIEIPADDYMSVDAGQSLQSQRSARARVWYSFKPADDAADEKPLVVFFNGGPGSSTAILFGLNTGPRSVDPERTGDAGYVDNPSSWTSFANLLYIDMPGTGYGYMLQDEGTLAADASYFSIWHDAAQFVTVVTRFLQRHPQIRNNRVAFAGESYGGLRAAAMHYLLLSHEELLDGELYRNERLHAELTEFFQDAPRRDDGSVDVQRQFAAQVMIQPYVGAPPVMSLASVCVPYGDLYQCDEVEGHSQALIEQVVDRLTDPAVINPMLGADIATIEWLYPKHRTKIFGRGDNVYAPSDDAALEQIFGSLAPDDTFYVASRSLDSWLLFTVPELSTALALYSMYFVDTFITNAQLDMVVPTSTFADFFNSQQVRPATATFDATAPAGSARPGVLNIAFDEYLDLPARVRAVRFPTYEQAGHAVSHRQPEALHADVSAWLAERL